MTNARKLYLTRWLKGVKKGLCCFSYAIWMGQEGAYDGDGVSAGFDYFSGIGLRDSANRHQRKLTDCVPDGPQSFETKHRGRVAFGGCSEDWTDREVVDRKFQSLDSLLDVMGRVTHDGLLAQQLSSGFRRHVILAQMNAIRAHSEGDIDAIIDNQPHVALRSDGSSDFGLLVKLLRRHLLFTQLYQRSPATAQQPDLLSV
jgi:hypothetical protein